MIKDAQMPHIYLISITVRKRRDPAILDREELFLQLDIEEIFFSEEFSVTPFQRLFLKWQTRIDVRQTNK